MAPGSHQAVQREIRSESSHRGPDEKRPASCLNRRVKAKTWELFLGKYHFEVLRFGRGLTRDPGNANSKDL